MSSLDAHGRTWRVVEKGAVTNPDGPNGDATTRYEYNPRDELVKIIDNTGVETIVDYNRLGWRIRLDDPNQGATVSRYLPNGVERWSRDARGVTIWSTYDAMSRLTGEYRNGIAADSKLADYTYDGLPDAVGELTRTRSYQPAGDLAAVERLESVDGAGRPRETSVRVPAASDPAIRGPHTFVSRYTRNGADWKRRLPGVAGSNLAEDEVLTHTYGTQGRLKRLASSMSVGNLIGGAGISYDQVGRLAQVPLRGGLHGLDLDYQYKRDDRLDAQFATVVGGDDDGERLVVNRYRYDPAGNPTSVRRITDLEGSGTSNE